MDDGIANGTYEPGAGEAQPLALFTAARVDYSLHRLRHYSGTAPEHFQNFVLFTNYQFYIDEFIKLGHELMADPAADYAAFVEPGNVVTRRSGSAADPRDAAGAAPPRLPQMPAYHLVRPGGSGITMVNIGVGPANAKTITDHVAVLRPHVWIMLGHCAGLRNTQQLGDYVLAHGYVREDHVLDEELPLWVPIPALAEVQLALERAVADVTQLSGYELKRLLRTGTVASTDNRNWELLPHPGPERRFSQSRAVALDMESRPPLRPMGSGSAFPTAPCCAYPTSPCTATSSCPAWPTSSTATASTSTCASACAPSNCCARPVASSCTAASCGASPRSPFSRHAGLCRGR